MLVWDNVGTCRSVSKHGASTVVYGGDGVRKREHVMTMNSILNGMQRVRTAELLNNRQELRDYRQMTRFFSVKLTIFSQVDGIRENHLFSLKY